MKNHPMNRYRTEIILGLSMVGLSLAFYAFHYLIFRDIHHILLYFIGDFAFVFIQVLLVTLIIERILDVREKESRLEKLNMVIGTFFSQAGYRLLEILIPLDRKNGELRHALLISPAWTSRHFNEARTLVRGYRSELLIRPADLKTLKSLSGSNTDFLLRLLENPSILEHESFTECLRAVFHLTEELSFRKNLNRLPAKDIAHLTADANRVFGHLVVQWVDYMEHLKTCYGYLYSLSVRTNPFDPRASVIVP